MIVPRCIHYASCYVYSPQGTSAVCQRSRLLCALLKSGDRYFIDRYVERIRQEVAACAPLAGFFSSDDLIVPVPSCTPRNGTNAPARLAEALVCRGLGEKSWCGLKRAHAVHKSATAQHRPTVAMHYDSLLVEPLENPPASLVLIDDVVTKGRTLLAAAARLHGAFPGARIRAFAVLRTMGLVSEVPRLFEPWRGCIHWLNGDARRDFGPESA